MTAPLDVLVTHMNAIKRNLKRNSNFPGSSEFLPSHMPPSDVLYDLTNTTFGGLLVVLWDSFLQYIIHHNQGHLCYEYVIIERLSSVVLSLCSEPQQARWNYLGLRRAGVKPFTLPRFLQNLLP